MEEWMWVVWLCIFLVTLIVEFTTDALVSIWFAASALLCLGLSFVPGLPFWGEILIFLCVSLLAFLALRPLLTKRLKRRIVPTNVDSMAGQKGEVKEWKDALHGGEVEVHGVIWNALPVRDELEIHPGDIVKVIMVNGNKLLVDKIEKEN